jgi:glycogen debranching enzyme
VLARHQGIDVDRTTGEEPGKILHEMRFGERADPTLGGAQVYYGSVDATPLFVMLVGQLLRFGTPREALLNLMPAVEDAIAWCRRFGDRDGDGFVEYETRPEAFLWNQGWKDSFDGVTFADGTLADGPIALCEVQGYVYAAYLAAAELRERLGRGDPAELRALAAALRRQFHDAFWMPAEGTYAIALDGEKRQVDSVSSNPGHLLWSGILDPDQASSVACRLLRPDCFTGFGIRTLSSEMLAFNPLSYHNGTVWPHDNGLAIAGMLRYGLVREAQLVTEGLLGSAPFFTYRLPELFGGFSAAEYAFPVPYLTACSPQAWAAGTPLLLLRAFLGLEPNVPEGVVYVNPQLPGDLSLEIRGVPIGGGRLSVRAVGADAFVTEVPPGVEVILGRAPLEAIAP